MDLDYLPICIALFNCLRNTNVVHTENTICKTNFPEYSITIKETAKQIFPTIRGQANRLGIITNLEQKRKEDQYNHLRKTGTLNLYGSRFRDLKSINSRLVSERKKTDG